MSGMELEKQSLLVDNQPIEYRSYSRRWFVMLSVTMLNIGNYAHWIAFASVQSKIAEFYQTSQENIQIIVIIQYSFGLPCSALATYVLAKHGLRKGLYIGGIFTSAGSFLCCLSTFPGFTEITNPSTWYWMSLVGQVLNGIACPFVSCVPTKVSQNWFNETQRPLATTILGLSTVVGLILGQALTPLFVTNPNDVPILNIVWFVPNFIGLILTIVTVTTSRPPTPPSKSADIEQDNISYWQTIKCVMKNKPFLLLIFVIGGSMAYASTVQTQNQPILCSLGYSDTFSGFVAALMFIGGIFGSALIGFIVNVYQNHMVKITKILSFFTGLLMICLGFILTKTKLYYLMPIIYFSLGFLYVGLYPTLLEFSVEETYPADESVTTAILLMSSSLFGVLLMQFDLILAKDYKLNPSSPETCTQLTESHIVPKNHDLFAIFLNCFGLLTVILFIIFYKGNLKRTKANQIHPNESINETN